MTKEVKGMFVRLPLSDEQRMIANEAPYKKDRKGSALEASILSIGTPIADAQIAAREVEIVQLRDVLVKAADALMRVTEERSTSYQAKNGKWVSIQGDDGERCDIIHSDITIDCEAALSDVLKVLKGGAA